MERATEATVKTLQAQNHYEVLEVRPGARREEIERAYRMATSTWADGSLALYSLFDDADAAAIRERIRHAYQVLSDDDARRAYDEEMFDSPPGDLRDGARRDSGAAARSDDSFDEIGAALDVRLTDGREQGDEFDGPQLRRARMNRGIEIQDVADVTKISTTYLESIEEEAFEQLPAAVYVRGFVSAYARTIGLDPKRVAASYMPRLEAARQGKGRGRLLGRS